MTTLPQPAYQVTATVTEIKGQCNAGLEVGDTFPLGSRSTVNMCGFFYSVMFVDLQTFEFGGKLPWWYSDMIEVSCPDSDNLVILQLQRK
jgi:uncharacterized repeat protein (TIGR04076 family)